MTKWRLISLILLMAVLPVTLAEGQKEVARGAAIDGRARAPWEWTDEERIAARLDKNQAEKRVITERESRRAKGDRQYRNPGTNALERQPADQSLADVIDGHRNPELFFPQQLFTSLLRHAFVSNEYADDYRAYHLKRAVTLGLPADLWDRIGVLAAPAVAALRREREALANAAEGSVVPREMALVSCRARNASYRELRKVLGPQFDRFLYEVIAPGAKLTYTAPPTYQEIYRQAGGCE